MILVVAKMKDQHLHLVFQLNNIEIINAYFAQNNYDKVNEDIANKIFDSLKK